MAVQNPPFPTSSGKDGDPTAFLGEVYTWRKEDLEEDLKFDSAALYFRQFGFTTGTIRPVNYRLEEWWTLKDFARFYDCPAEKEAFDTYTRDYLSKVPEDGRYFFPSFTDAARVMQLVFRSEKELPGFIGVEAIDKTRWEIVHHVVTYVLTMVNYRNHLSEGFHMAQTDFMREQDMYAKSFGKNSPFFKRWDSSDKWTAAWLLYLRLAWKHQHWEEARKDGKRGAEEDLESEENKRQKDGNGNAIQTSQDASQTRAADQQTQAVNQQTQVSNQQTQDSNQIQPTPKPSENRDQDSTQQNTTRSLNPFDGLRIHENQGQDSTQQNTTRSSNPFDGLRIREDSVPAQPAANKDENTQQNAVRNQQQADEIVAYTVATLRNALRRPGEPAIPVPANPGGIALQQNTNQVVGPPARRFKLPTQQQANESQTTSQQGINQDQASSQQSTNVPQQNAPESTTENMASNQENTRNAREPRTRSKRSTNQETTQGTSAQGTRATVPADDQPLLFGEPSTREATDRRSNTTQQTQSTRTDPFGGPLPSNTSDPRRTRSSTSDVLLGPYLPRELRTDAQRDAQGPQNTRAPQNTQETNIRRSVQPSAHSGISVFDMQPAAEQQTRVNDTTSTLQSAWADPEARENYERLFGVGPRRQSDIEYFGVQREAAAENARTNTQTTQTQTQGNTSTQGEQVQGTNEIVLIEANDANTNTQGPQTISQTPNSHDAMEVDEPAENENTEPGTPESNQQPGTPGSWEIVNARDSVITDRRAIYTMRDVINGIVFENGQAIASIRGDDGNGAVTGTPGSQASTTSSREAVTEWNASLERLSSFQRIIPASPGSHPGVDLPHYSGQQQQQQQQEQQEQRQPQNQQNQQQNQNQQNQSQQNQSQQNQNQQQQSLMTQAQLDAITAANTAANTGTTRNTRRRSQPRETSNPEPRIPIPRNPNYFDMTNLRRAPEATSATNTNTTTAAPEGSSPSNRGLTQLFGDRSQNSPRDGEVTYPQLPPEPLSQTQNTTAQPSENSSKPQRVDTPPEQTNTVPEQSRSAPEPRTSVADVRVPENPESSVPRGGFGRKVWSWGGLGGN